MNHNLKSYSKSETLPTLQSVPDECGVQGWRSWLVNRALKETFEVQIISSHFSKAMVTAQLSDAFLEALGFSGTVFLLLGCSLPSNRIDQVALESNPSSQSYASHTTKDVCNWKMPGSLPALN